MVTTKTAIQGPTKLAGFPESPSAALDADNLPFVNCYWSFANPEP
jgi:hypothetical protein